MRQIGKMRKKIAWLLCFVLVLGVFLSLIHILFAMLALAGDLGCSGGPTLVGFVSSAFSSNLRLGILTAIVFPVLLLAGLCTFSRLVVQNVD